MVNKFHQMTNHLNFPMKQFFIRVCLFSDQTSNLLFFFKKLQIINTLLFVGIEVLKQKKNTSNENQYFNQYQNRHFLAVG